MNDLTKLRQQIDDLDQKMLLLLQERLELAGRIAVLKAANGQTICDPQREEELLNACCCQLNKAEFAPYCRDFFNCLMTISKLEQAKVLLKKRGKHIYLTGLPLSGKTTLGARAAEILQIPFVDTDEEIEKNCGKTIKDIFAQEGEAAFRQKETYLLKQLMHQEGQLVVACGGGIVCREENLALLQKSGLIIQIHREPSVLQDDSQLAARPLLNNEEDLLNLARQRGPLYQNAADLIFLNQEKSAAEQLAALIRSIIFA